MSQITYQTGRERRRYWSEDERREIVRAAFLPDAVVTTVARRYEVSTSLIYKWRRQGVTRPDVTFVPAVVVADPVLAPGPAVGTAIVIDLAGGTRLTIDGQASVGLVGAILRALR